MITGQALVPPSVSALNLQSSDFLPPNAKQEGATLSAVDAKGGESSASSLEKGKFERRSWFGDIRYQGWYYTGGIKDGKPHGRGILAAKLETNAMTGGCINSVPKNTEYYDGEWVDGKKQGKGIYDYGDGDKYEGEFQDDKKTGKGKFTYTSQKAVDEGTYIDSVIQVGKRTFIDREVFEGTFRDGQRDFGTATWKDGRVLVAHYVKGLLNGQGVMTWPNGDKYEGEFTNNSLTGKGKFFHAAEMIDEEGTFVSGKLHGVGTRTLADGTVQKGRFENGKYMPTMFERFLSLIIS